MCQRRLPRATRRRQMVRTGYRKPAPMFEGRFLLMFALAVCSGCARAPDCAAGIVRAATQPNLVPDASRTDEVAGGDFAADPPPLPLHEWPCAGHLQLL